MSSIWVYTIARNEQILLPYFLRHYAFADRIILFDHMSTDDTKTIAWKAGVEVWPFLMYEKVDEIVLTHFINEQYKEARGKADWVIWVDVDEILYHPDMRGYLDRCKMRGVTIPKTQGYTMIANRLPSGDGQIYDELREGVPDDLYSKFAVFSPNVDINYELGRHRAHPRGRVIFSQTPVIKLLHYRYFGPEWLAKRNAEHWANLSDLNKRSGWGAHIAPDNVGRYSQSWYDAQIPERVL